MTRSLRHISIHSAVIAALASFVMLIVVLAGISFMADRNAQANLSTYSLISNSQLNEINRADSLLNQGMLAMETASNFLMARSNAPIQCPGRHCSGSNCTFRRAF